MAFDIILFVIGPVSRNVYTTSVIMVISLTDSNDVKFIKNTKVVVLVM